MDTDKLVTHSRVRFEHAVAKRTLKEKYQAKLVFAYSGGMFQAGPELISSVQSLPDPIGIIQDLYGNPVKVNAKELIQLSQQLWQETMWHWFDEYEELNKKR